MQRRTYLVAGHDGISARIAPSGVLEEREHYEPDDRGDGEGLQVDGQVVTSPRHDRRERLGAVDACRGGGGGGARAVASRGVIMVGYGCEHPRILALVSLEFMLK